MAWSTSNRSERLPADWSKRVAAVKRRARGRCEAKYHDAACDGVGQDVDHIMQGDDHRLSNLQLLSRVCHTRKTRLDNGYSAAVRRPPEPHPGAIRRGGEGPPEPPGPQDAR